MASETVSAGKIGLDLVINQNQFNRQLAGIKGIATKAGAVIAGAFGVKKLADFGKQCIELGSDLAEVQNVVDVTFSSMSAKVDNFAKKAAGSFGLSETMAKKYTGTFGAMAKAFGFNEKAAYDMSTTLTGLAGDVASFYNISQDEAYTKLKSVFTGETETLKDLGVVITQNALDAYAMANGYGKTTSAMSEAEKVALRYAFVQDKLTTAAGDFARTSGSWANQVKILSLQFESFKATIGQGLINVFTPVIRVVNILIGRLLTLANAFKLFTGYFSSGGSSKTEKSTKKISNNAKQISKNFSSAQGAATRMGAAGSKAANKVGKAAEKASKKVRSLMGFDQINKLSDDSKSSGSSTGSGGGGSSSGIGSGSIPVDDFDTGSAGDEEKIGKLPKLYENLAKAIDRFKKACSGLGGVLSGALKWGYENVLKPLGKWTISKLVPKVLDVFSGALRVVTEVCKALAPIGQKLWDVFFKPLAKFAGDTIIKFLDLLQKGLNRLADWIGKHQDLVRVFGMALVTMFAAFKYIAFVDKAKKALGLFSIVVKNTKLGGLVKAFLALPMPVKIAIGVLTAVVAAGILVYKNWDKISKKLKQFVSLFKNKWKEIQKEFKKTADNLKKSGEAIKKIPEDLKKLFKEKIEGVEEWFSGIRDGLTNTLENLADAVPDMSEIREAISAKIGEIRAKVSAAIDTAKDWWSGIKEGISEKIGTVKAAVEALVNLAKDKWNSVAGWVKEHIGGAISKAIGLAKDGWDNIKDWVAKFIGGGISKAIGLAKDKWDSVAKWVKDNIGGGISKAIGLAKDGWSNVRDWVKDRIGGGISKAIGLAKDGWSNVRDWVKDRIGKGSVSKAISLARNKWKSVTSWVKDKIGKGTVSIWVTLKKKASSLWSKIADKKADGGVYKNGRWSKIQQYASGGTPDQGQMFIAREKGPELVGTLGGHTAVMNNDQIVASVSSGVAKAVSAAMGRVGQSLYNAVSNLKIESKLPQIEPVTPPPLALANTQSTTSDNKKMIDLLTAISNENKTNLELMRQFMALVAGLDLDVKLNGKSIKDDVVKRINNNTRATGKCEIIM